MAKPESEYRVEGVLSNPFTASNKAEKAKQQDLLRKQKEDEKREKEAKVKADKDAKKEEARLLKEAALAEKIKKRTVETELSHADEQKKKEEERLRVSQMLQDQEEKLKSDKLASDLRKKAEESTLKERKEREEAEARQKIEAEKKMLREKREKDLKDEEANAEFRAKEIAAARELQLRVEDAKRKGMLPENFIPVVWGKTDAARKEIEEILEKPYWEKKDEPELTALPKDPSDVVKCSSRAEDPWLQDKRKKQSSVPWSAQLMKVVVQSDLLPPVEPVAEKKMTLVEHFRNIVGGRPAEVTRGEPVLSSHFRKSADVSLQVAPVAKAQAAALWAAIARGETAEPLSYDGFTLEGYGKMNHSVISSASASKFSKAANVSMPPPEVEEVIELVAALSTDQSMHDGDQSMSPNAMPESVEPVTKLSSPSLADAATSSAMMKIMSAETDVSSPSLATASLAMDHQAIMAAAKEAHYGKKESMSAPVHYGSKPVTTGQGSEAIYGTKSVVGAPAPVVSPYGTKPSATALGQQSESVYGTKPTAATDALGSKAPESVYGTKPPTVVEEPTRVYGRMSISTVGATPTTPSRSSSDAGQQLGAHQPSPAPDTSIPIQVKSEEGYGSKIAAARKSEAAVNKPPQIIQESEYAYGAMGTKPKETTAPAAPQSISPEQVTEMISRMNPQQRRQAYDMLSAAVGKGHQLSPQQKLLHTLLEKHMAPQPEAYAVSTKASDEKPAEDAGKKGLFFQLPTKQKFQFGIPGREIITLRHFDWIADKKKRSTEKVLLVICNDISFLCKQVSPDNAGVYELFDKPTQRDKVTAENDTTYETGFAIKLGKDRHVLIAQSKEEKLYWIQNINARANFVPTSKLVA